MISTLNLCLIGCLLGGLALVAPASAQSKGANLLEPSSLKANAPSVYVVNMETSKGTIVIRVNSSWAPVGAKRFYNLVRAGFYDNTYFFRVLDFMVQFGINSDPKVSAAWDGESIQDDRPTQGNSRGTVSFAAMGAPNTRSTQVFINKLNNTHLDALQFAPFGEVIQGMDVVDALYAGHRESPQQLMIESQGEPYLNRYFPRLDKIVKMTVIER